MKMAGVDKDKLLHSLLNRSRLEIVSHLLDKEQNISDLEKQTGIGRSAICYHLSVLEDVGMLESRYVILEAARSKGRAARIYSINHDKLQEAIKAIEELTIKATRELGRRG